MKKVIFFIFSLFIFTSCSYYEVIQEVGDNQYHMYKKGRIEIITSDKKLIIGETYNIKKIQSK